MMKTDNRLREVWNKKKVELRLTQERAAELLGYEHQSTVSQYLNGKAPLSMENTVKFANLLGVKPEEIRPDLAEMFQYIRNTGHADFNASQPGWVRLTDEETDILNLFKRLPESEKDQFVEELKASVEKYDKLFNELLKIRNQ